MKESKKTMIFSGIAIFLALLAFITAPNRVTPDAFLDKDELFFAEFTDPNEAATLEVINFDEETGSAIPFKVTFENGKWTIPSHHNYPADGEDRLAKTAAGVIGIKKDEFRSDNPADYEALGVIDPLDETSTSLKGRGQRITLKGKNGNILADFIISKEEVAGKEKFRFVRIPEKKRVYAARMDIDLSTKFTDWIEKDLLEVDKDAITELTIKDYSIDERSGSIEQRDVVNLDKEGGNWQADKMAKNQEINTTKMNDLLKALDELSIVGVRPKPAGLTTSLEKAGDGLKISSADMMSLQSKGYYFSRNGQLLSNEGELQAKTKDGVIYTLRFGEIVYGSGLEVTAGTASDEEAKESEKSGENRYLFITTEFDPKQFKEPAKPGSTDFQTKPDSLWTDADKENKRMQDEYDRWQTKIEKSQELSEQLNDRFAQWYYVISSESFDKLNLTRKELLQEKNKDS